MRIQLVILAAAANAAMLKLDSFNEALLNANETEAEAAMLTQAGENPKCASKCRTMWGRGPDFAKRRENCVQKYKCKKWY